MHRSSPYGYQSGKGSKDYGKNKYDSCGKGRKDYGKGSMSSIMLESMSDRIEELERICESLKLENERLKEDYKALLENERELEVDNERLRHGITQHAEQASKLKDSLNELAYPYATIR